MLLLSCVKYLACSFQWPSHLTITRSRIASPACILMKCIAQYLDVRKDGTVLKSNNLYLVCCTATGDTDANRMEQWVYDVDRAQGFIQVSPPGLGGGDCLHELAVVS